MSIYIIVSNSICIFVSRGSSSVNMFSSSTISFIKTSYCGSIFWNN